MEILLVSLILVCGFLLVLFFRSQQSQRNDQSMLMIQQQVEALRAEVRSSLGTVTDNVNRQLVFVSQQLQSQSEAVGSRLDGATRLMGDVQKNLGELGQAAREMKELGQSLATLEDLLGAPKLRGGLGEYLLEDLLKQVLPAAHVRMQHRFRGGQVVDAAITLSDRIVPVDSKFPLENFRRMVAAADDSERRLAERAFVGDVKKHIDAIASKYILPDEGTFPFALMYIPAENIYYEVIIKDSGAPGEMQLYNYAVQRKVVPVSPNSLYAYLQVIALGLRGMAVHERAGEILDTLERLGGDVIRLREVFDTLGTHLENASKKYGEAEKRLSAFENRLQNATDHVLPGEAPHELVAEHNGNVVI
jgi:DNA recombination protein RmuC